MAKTVRVSVNAIVAFTLLIVVCCSFMFYQKHQFDDLMQEYVDLKWESGNTAANLVIARNHLEECKAAAADNALPPGE